VTESWFHLVAILNTNSVVSFSVFIMCLWLSFIVCIMWTRSKEAQVHGQRITKLFQQYFCHANEHLIQNLERI
jgi:hypothetical protein